MAFCQILLTCPVYVNLGRRRITLLTVVATLSVHSLILCEMVGRKSPKTLVDLSLSALSILVTTESLRVAKIAVTKFVYDEVEHGFDEEEVSNAAWEREVYLSDQIELFKQHVLGCMSYPIMEKAIDPILNGIKAAILHMKRQWSPTTNMKTFTRQMYAVVKFSNLLVTPQMKKLDLAEIPKMVRTKLYGCLKAFSGLRILRLGSGSGGWVTDAYAECYLTGIPQMKHLVHFSLSYDCTLNVLQVLSETCGRTLRLLDIERSKQIQDDAVEYILKCSNLEEINIFQTGLTTQGQANILLGLERLCHLDRGDFLCDVLDHLHSQGMSARFKIQEFWASEEYYFHSEEQMELTNFYCPEIRKILFMFQNTSSRLSVLRSFEKLEDLELWGGAFYSDGLCDLLEAIGTRLKRLSMVHVEEVDEKALAFMTITCPNLESLGFHNVEFIDRFSEEDQDVAFRLSDRYLQMEAERELKTMMVPFLSLRCLKIVSNCSANFLCLIVGLCLNVEEIFMGMNTAIDDDCVVNILAVNGLQYLTSLTVQRSKAMTMKGVNLLLDSCDNLKVLKDLAYFEKINEMEVKLLQGRIKSENLDLDIGCEPSNNEFSEASFMRQALRAKFPALDNSVEWEAGWSEST